MLGLELTLLTVRSSGVIGVDMRDVGVCGGDLHSHFCLYFYLF